MTKVLIPKPKLEELILREVRRHGGCEAFKSIKLYRQVNIVDPGSNWAAAFADYGNAKVEHCEVILQEVIRRLQRHYTLQDELARWQRSQQSHEVAKLEVGEARIGECRTSIQPDQGRMQEIAQQVLECGYDSLSADDRELYHAAVIPVQISGR